jgi:hypothetical protein
MFLKKKKNSKKKKFFKDFKKICFNKIYLKKKKNYYQPLIYFKGIKK